ncbi:MAG: DUF3987 domain-containing protein, partial [Candidatus Brocadiia bacterium]
MHDDPIHRLISRLDGVKKAGPNQWTARCPAHEDHNPSLSVGRGRDGRALVKCHAGCAMADVLSAVGLSKSDLFTDSRSRWDSPPGTRHSVRNAAKNAGWPGRIVAEYDYTDGQGNLLFQVVRLEPKGFRQRRPDGNGNWTWYVDGTPRVLYHLPDLLAADPSAWVFVVEGEKDADALAEIGLIATTNPGGANSWGHLSDDSALHGRRVAIVPDRDRPGGRHAQDVAARLHGKAADVRIVDLGRVEGFEGKDVSDWLEWLDSRSSTAPAQALTEMAEAAPVWDGEEWPVLVPLRGDMGDPPRFPVEVLPRWFGNMVSAVAEATQTPPELAGTVGLGILALAGAGKVEVEPLPGWREPLNLFMAVALPPGCRKSAVFRAMTGPLVEWERAERKRLTPEIGKAKTERAILEKRLAKLKKKAADGDQQAERDAVSLAVELGTKSVPAFPRLFTGDATPEGVARLLAEQGGRLGVLSAEGGELTAILAGRYSRTGRSNMEVFLKGHAGDAIRVDRANRDRAPIILDHPALTVVLCVQPSVLESAWQHREFGDRGLLARFLCVLPPNPLGNREVAPPSVPDYVERAYEDAVRRLLGPTRTEGERDESECLTLTDEAQALLKEFMRRLEPELGPGGRYEHMTGWAGKLPGAVARIAGGLHLGHRPAEFAPWRAPVEADTMGAALALGEFYAAHAERVQGAYGGSPEARMAGRALGWIKGAGVDTFPVRDLYRALGVRK